MKKKINTIFFKFNEIIISHSRKKNVNKKFFYLIFLFPLLLSFVNQNNKLYSKETSKPTIDYLKKNPKFEYILGAGDKLQIKIDEEQIINNDELKLNIYSIDSDGTINLPNIYRVYVEGLTTNELKNILNERYKEFIKNPDIKINVVKFRPLAVYVNGEVENPGLYNLNGLKELNTNNANNINFYKLFDLIKLSGGITQYSDLSNVEITRINPLSNGGGRIKASINLLNLFTEGNQEQNIRILDGDSITVRRSDDQAIAQLTDALKSNINPDSINIYVGGRVETPGNVSVNKLSSLNEAIDMSGGIKSMKGQVRHIRYKNNGDIERNKFRYMAKAKRGTLNNPILQSGDIVFVTRGGLKTTTDILSDITEPIKSLGNSYLLFKALND